MLAILSRVPRTSSAVCSCHVSPPARLRRPASTGRWRPMPLQCRVSRRSCGSGRAVALGRAECPLGGVSLGAGHVQRTVNTPPQLLMYGAKKLWP